MCLCVCVPVLGNLHLSFKAEQVLSSVQKMIQYSMIHKPK